VLRQAVAHDGQQPRVEAAVVAQPVEPHQSRGHRLGQQVGFTVRRARKPPREAAGRGQVLVKQRPESSCARFPHFTPQVDQPALH